MLNPNRSVRRGFFAIRSVATPILMLMFVPLPALAQVEIVDPANVSVPLAAGASASIEFTLRNNGATTANALLNTNLFSSAVNVYSLQSIGPCAVPLGFPLPKPTSIPISAGAEVNCRYSVLRRVDAFSDTVLGFNVLQAGPGPSLKSFLLGDLTRLQADQVILQGATMSQPGRVRLILRNDGPTAISELLYSACSPGIAANEFVEVVAGPCEQIGPTTCGAGTFQTGFRQGALPVGAAVSCEFRLPPGTSVLFPLRLELRKAGGATLVNTHPGSDELRLGGVAPMVAVPLPQSLAVIAASSMLLAGAGLWRLRFRR